ncbi:MAG: sulfatase-like hydrolase/transferase [Bacteroidota bacterium]|nr:sulfatase-like hydrolase/transferase [Bacteroidota bacterium]
MEETSSTSLERLMHATRRYIAYCAILLLVIITLRIYEAFAICSTCHFSQSSLRAEFYGLLCDGYVFLRICAFLVIPYCLLFLLKSRVAEWFFGACVILITITSIVLQLYFATSLVPLGSDLFGYSFSEISHTVGASGGLRVLTLMPFLLFLAFVAFLWWLLRNKNFPNLVFYFFYIAVAISLLLNDYSSPSSGRFKTEYESYLASNKLGFFISKTYNYFKEEEDKRNQRKSLSFNQLNVGSSKISFHYVNKEYPLLHTVDSTDVLGNFFTINKSQKPNLVFILVESLGRAYSGENAYLGSFTPFLDSLMQKSLYWENFLSTGGRTFAVLPSVFGSLPFGDKGFNELNDKMPRHLSLIRLLKSQGYQSSFIYGGDAHFDLMDVFMHAQGIDKITDTKSFGPGYSKLPANNKGFAWGYGDREIFRKILESATVVNTKPRLDIALTLAMHDPFRVPNQEYYNNRFEAQLNTLNLSEQEKRERRNYKPQFASMLYFDDALRYFISAYSKRPDFKNTIFVITGDHRMPEIPISTQLDRFHVPLVIYSPMLKRPAKFSSVSVQFDITPSILAFLSNNYDMKFPSLAHWMGIGLDTIRTFRNIHAYPLMRNKNEMVDYIKGLNFLSSNVLYNINDNLTIDAVDKTEQTKELQKDFENFKRLNNYVCSTNHIIPDTLYHNWSKIK